MLYTSQHNQYLWTTRILYVTLLLLYTFVQLSVSFATSDTYNGTSTMLSNNLTSNSVGDDLYVIKAVVYEIGILTDADNATNDTTESHEEVKLSFYNPPNNSYGP